MFIRAREGASSADAASQSASRASQQWKIIFLRRSKKVTTLQTNNAILTKDKKLFLLQRTKFQVLFQMPRQTQHRRKGQGLVGAKAARALRVQGLLWGRLAPWPPLARALQGRDKGGGDS